ncbi:MAG: hypothetical protein ABFD51_02195 [Anaerolineaceae bacterium]
MPNNKNIEAIQLLISRLERLSADSFWAHRASGIRGALLRFMDAIDNVEENQQIQDNTLNILIQKGYELLEKAAREIPDRK